MKLEDLKADNPRFYEAITEENEVARVITSAAFLDECIASILQAHFIDGSTSDSLLRSEGALSAFLDRAKLAYVLGLIAKEVMQNLERVARIRNRFAHKYRTITFDDPEVARITAEFTMPAAEGEGIHPTTGQVFKFTEWPFFSSGTPSRRFTIVVAHLFLVLIRIGNNIQRCQKTNIGWEDETVEVTVHLGSFLPCLTVAGSTDCRPNVC